MEATELRPLSLGELLDRTFTLYRGHFWLFVGIMAIPSAFSIPFNIEFLSMRGTAAVGGRPSTPYLIGFGLVAAALLFLFSILYCLAIGATTYAVSETYLGQPATVRDSYGKVRGRFWGIIGVMLNIFLRMIGVILLGSLAMGIVLGLSAILVRFQGGGAIMGVVFAVLFVIVYLGFIVFMTAWSLRYAVSISALLLEKLGVLAAIRRSAQLTRGRRWQIFVGVWLSMIIGYAGVIVFQGPLIVVSMLSAQRGYLPTWLIFSSSVLGAIGGAITMPLPMIVLVLCYYDTRIRKEAFDLQFLMSALDQSTPGQSTVSPA